MRGGRRDGERERERERQKEGEPGSGGRGVARQIGGSLRGESIYPEKGHADEIT